MSQPVPPLNHGLDRFINRHIRDVQPYAPIAPPDILEEESGVAQADIVKLDGNENPYAPSQRVLQAVAEYPHYNLYPDPEHRTLRRALANYTGLGAECIVPGSGSDEIIDLILRLFVERGDEIVIMPPTFGMYSFDALIVGGQVIEVPRGDDLGLDVPAVLKAVNERTKVILLASPNNPTGDLITRDELGALLGTGVPVVVDEAYYEFAGETVADMVNEHENLIVLRTFSKWAGLAGLRVGYGLMPAVLAARLFLIKQPYNVNAAGQRAAEESLADQDFLLDTVATLVRDRAVLSRQLEETGFLHPRPSRANFVLCQVTGVDAKYLADELRKRGIFIRYFDTKLLRGYIRVSVGTPEHHEKLVSALKEITTS